MGLCVQIMSRATGECVKWRDDRGFGFIRDAEGKEHYVHFSALQVENNGFRALAIGQQVEFDVTDQGDKTRCENVTAIGGGPLPPGEKPAQDSGRGGRGGGFGGGRGGGGYGGRDGGYGGGRDGGYGGGRGGGRGGSRY